MPMTPMVAGMRIASRFVLEEPAARGAMGMVFQARDLQTGQRVALKLLHSAHSLPQSVTRLELEAELLAKLRHPGIVAHIAHGRTANGLPFLAMEWLDGEDLGQRLSRCLLSLSECLQLLRGVASALDVAHRSGVIHRDIKPSNLFLPAGRIDHIKLLDFGIAREEFATLALTRSGSILGTLDYMAPEQVRMAHQVGPAADIFSLGCVLYECLTGRPPLPRQSFPDRHFKILTQEIPPLNAVRQGLPPAFVTLVQRMLAKDPEQRPPDGAALLRELELLGGELADDASADVRTERPPFAPTEQRLLSVVLASSLGPWARASTLDESESDTDAQLPHKDATLLRWGALTEVLGDGSLLVTITERGSASDLAAQAARLARHLAQRWPSCTAVVATGLGVVTNATTSGAVVDRVLEFIHAQRASELLADRSRSRIWLDEVTGGLVDAQFTVHRAGPGLFELGAERDYVGTVRTLAGQLTPCVGRDRELASLAALLDECVDDSMARAVLLVAPQGRGKSRLRHELLTRLRSSHPALIVLLARGDPLCSGVSGALLTNFLCRLAGVASADPLAAAQAKLRAMLRRVLPIPQFERWQVALCNLGTQLLRQDSDPHTTRPEQGVSSEHDEQAFVQLMRALSACGPLLIVGEDLHHADLQSVRVLDLVLGELAERPLMVLALARPEVHNIFPKLWAEHRVQELRLEPLLPSACEQLIDAVLEPQHRPAVLPHILQHGRGNALFLEELLLTALRDPLTRQLPATLITLEQQRLLSLPTHALQVLRAASIFGMHFWEDGIYALLEPLLPREQIDSGLQILLRAELIFRQRHSRFPPSPQYYFGHALSLFAVAPLLTAADRERGRVVATRYL